MKAYSVSDRNGDCEFSYIVFAETRAKATKRYESGGIDYGRNCGKT